MNHTNERFPSYWARLFQANGYAALGQILLKLGAGEQPTVYALANVRVVTGFALYGVGAVLWLISLRDLPLSIVYPFTLLTLAFVIVASIFVLGERPNPVAIFGCAAVCTGIMIVATGSKV